MLLKLTETSRVEALANLDIIRGQCTNVFNEKFKD